MPEQTISVLSDKLRYTIEQLMIFIQGEVKVSPLNPSEVKHFLQIAHQLKTAKSGGAKEEEDLYGAVKDLIRDVNALVPSSPRYPRFPHYPKEGAIAQVQAHIIAFELFLNHRLRLDQLSLEKEAPLFSKALILWRDVGQKLSPKEAVDQLSAIIKEANQSLPKEEHYPLPNSSFF